MLQSLPVVIEGLRFSALRASAGLSLCTVALVACIGGPHPLPPGEEQATASGGVPDRAPMAANGAAGRGAATPGSAPAPTMPPTATPGTSVDAGANPNAAGSGSMAPASPPPGANGMGAAPGGGGPAPTPPAGGSGGGSGADGGFVCDGPTGALSASSDGPTNLLFVMDRSTDMATDFEGAPRWQMVAEAMSHAFGARANELTMGAVLYPSAGVCEASSWFCSLREQSMCEVSAMSAEDQVAFQPASEALSALAGDAGLYAPAASAAGVPLAESLARADAALSAQQLDGKTAVVILASGTPSCGWNDASASATVAKWRTERGVQTHVFALPGSPAATAPALAALAEAGGTGRVHAPVAAGALEATLQSIVFESSSSCTIELDSPAPDPSAVQVLVTENGVERVLPRVSATGDALWSISSDGGTVTLTGNACETARSGGYEGVRIVLSCAR